MLFPYYALQKKNLKICKKIPNGLSNQLILRILKNFPAQKTIPFRFFRNNASFKTSLERKGIMESWNDGILMLTFL